MTNHTITVEKIELRGFRAYLKPATFNLKCGKIMKSLAIFAPNGQGKSSLIDAFEYYLSERGTLKRLGERKYQTRAGPKALAHVDAKREHIAPMVHFWFRQGDDKFNDPRPIPNTGSNVLPTAAERVASHTLVPMVIRGHELRHFVETTTPEDRYRELTTWFDLEPLRIIQKNLQQLKREVKKKIDSTDEAQIHLRRINQLTNSEVSKLEERDILEWFNTGILEWLNTSILARLTTPLKFQSMSKDDPSFEKLLALAEREKEQAKPSTLNQIHDLVTDIIGLPESTHEDTIGKLTSFENAIRSRQDAFVKLTNTESVAQQSIFNEVWESAKKLFDKNDELDVCPICDTEFHDSPHRSRDQILVTLDEKIAGLKEYREAKKELDAADQILDKTKTNLTNKLETLDSFPEYTNQEITTYLDALRSWKVGEESPASNKISVALSDLLDTIKNNMNPIKNGLDRSAYVNALDIIKQLLTIKLDLEQMNHVKCNLKKILDHLNQQANAFDKAIADYVNKIINNLQDETRSLYKDIQGSDSNVPPIRIELPNTDDKNQHCVHLHMDFNTNHKNVLPSGYLSDSQIHTLALALRLAAIRMFNPQAPIVVLDDIVTSYDIDHRKTIASVLAEKFTNFQIFLVTHDEQFFNILRDHLPRDRWDFKRITKIQPGLGPVIHGHYILDEVIDNKLNANESAANEIRQAEEDWLGDICRAFRTTVDIRQIGHENNHSRSELALSLMNFLKHAQIIPPSVPGMSDKFLNSLQSGYIENLGSHSPENPNKRGSIGDEKVRWKEFKCFRNKFVCIKCGKRKFHRPIPLPRPVCVSCQEPFAFPDNHPAT